MWLRGVEACNRGAIHLRAERGANVVCWPPASAIVAAQKSRLTALTRFAGVRRRAGDVEGALTFAQQELSGLSQRLHLLTSPQLPAEEAEAMLQDVVALIAYQDPAASPLAWVLSQEQRERVADVVNAAVLQQAALGAASAAPACPSSNGLPAGPAAGGATAGSAGGGQQPQQQEQSAYRFAPVPLLGGAGLAPQVPVTTEQLTKQAVASASSVPALQASALELLLRQLMAVRDEMWQQNGRQGLGFSLDGYLKH